MPDVLPDERPLRVLVVDDDAFTREALGAVFGESHGFTLAGTAGSGEAAVAFVREHPVDVVVMDVHMPGIGGAAAAAQIVKRHRSVRVVAVTSFDSGEGVGAMLRAGAVGHLDKSESRAHIREAVRAAAAGGITISPRDAPLLREQLAGPATRRRAEAEAWAGTLREDERRMVALAATGRTNRQIAEALYVSEGLVKQRLSLIYQSLPGGGGRERAAILADRAGLLES